MSNFSWYIGAFVFLILLLVFDARKGSPAYTATMDTMTVPLSTDTVERGKILYEETGCSGCHGVAGTGGIHNFNYIQDEKSPPLNNVAWKMFLRDEESLEVALSVLKSGEALDEVQDLDVPRAAVVAVQYTNVVNKIKNGSSAQKLDPDGAEPAPMPSWSKLLNDKDIHNIITYLVSQQTFE